MYCCIAAFLPQIRFVILQNRQGKTRLSKWYVPFEYDDKAGIEQTIHRMITTRDSKCTNFIEVSCLAFVCDIISVP